MQLLKTTMTEPFIWRPPLRSPGDASRALYRPCLQVPAEIARELARSRFNGVVWKHDGVILNRLSQIPDLGSLIRSVKFNLTRTDRDMFQEALAEIKDPQKRAETEDLYLSSQGEATEPSPFPRKLVAASLKNLPNLESVTFTWVECPWKKHMAIDGPSFEEESLARAGNEVFKTQQTIIEALRERNLPLKSLTLEPFMPRCVLALSSFDPAVSTVFSSITELTLKLDYGVDVFKPDYLECFISLMPNIRRLSIHAWSVNDEASGIDICKMKRLRYLESVDFSGLKFKYGTLANFFSHHGSTIKQINLNNLFLWREPVGKRSLGWDDMFLGMKKRLTALEGIRISGTFTDDAGQHRVFFRYDDPNVDMHSGSCLSETEESASLEDYVLEKVESFTPPQPEWRALHHRNARKRTWALPTPPPESY
ncbi:hypothetical protein N0V84_010175 [Fusarium piperis]|uniref:Uncharacterized protein n=1 Tax=Fusarium piperis TaxID=1435070 RepID=A0A9W8W4Y0_9HYPO|nr:hypothetical protein N0V84_010175 [Fusarium piperis]